MNNVKYLAAIFLEQTPSSLLPHNQSHQAALGEGNVENPPK